MIARLFHTVLVAAALAALAAPLRAEDLRELSTVGRAADASEARALDDAFSAAVERVLGELLTPDALRRHGELLRRELVARPRRYVASYTVQQRRAVEGALALRVLVRVDRDRVREALVARGIDPAAGSAPAGDTGRPPLVVLLKATAGEETVTTFGSTGGDGGAAGRAAARELETRGFDVTSAAGTRAPTETGETGDSLLPLGDDAAAALAGELGAGGALVVGVQAAGDGPIRGTRLRGAVARASVRVIDARSGALVARIASEGSGYGADEVAAAGAAQEEAIAAALVAVEQALRAYWPIPVAAGEHTLVGIRGAVTWSPVAAVIQRLASTPGVIAVHPRRVRGDRVVLAVETRLRPEEIVAAVRRARLVRGQVAARVARGGVDVVVAGDSKFSVLED